MKVQIRDHQDKARALREALIKGGHEIVHRNADILLIDFDGPIAHYPKTIERAYEEGADVYLYSHGAHPITAWDGIWTPSERVSAYLAQTPGQKHVMEAYGYPYPIHVIGWHYCQQRPFQPTAGRKVLFAPWHPQGTGYLPPDGRRANAEIFDKLAQLDTIQLKVRHVGPLEWNCIPEIDGVEYEPSDKTLAGSIASILASDVVVSYGTLAYLAVALGKPTIMYGQDCMPYDGYSEETLRYVKHWEKYRDLMHYPHDADGLGVYGLNFLIHTGAQVEATKWRQEFIGEQFDGPKFCALIEELDYNSGDEF